MKSYKNTSCSVAGCQSKGFSRGFCRLHYAHDRRAADPVAYKEKNSRESKSPHRRYQHLVKTAAARGLEMNLTQQEHQLLLKYPCHYCDGKLNETGVGLDRIDSSQGYIATNVVPCCKLCNQAKMNLDINTFLKHCRAIVDNCEER